MLRWTAGITQTASTMRRSESRSALRRLPTNFVKLALDSTATFHASRKTPTAKQDLNSNNRENDQNGGRSNVGWTHYTLT
ncbi:hypothetical protein Y032_0009g474 [Ancylostoma ceylanicum]|uniref:Uncharacterized protein n=1 Tax=Ancylostoma ceylanicum TaxID=53326 RepID=A0A016VJT7_9BILA|nr:hypothetical protein Y032_0009g474 [Ancylostoma ceylanicum]